MKTRLISSAVALVLLAAALVWYNTWVFNIILSAVCALGVYELLKAFKYNETHRALSVAGIICAVIIPLSKTPWYNLPIKALVFIYIMIMFGVLLKQHEKLRLEEVGVVFMMSISIPLSLSCLLFIRDTYTEGYLGLFYILLALGAAWLADSGAYFAGRFFGKHKLAPKVSPKKTVEGCIGGLLSSALCFMLLGLIYAGVAKTLKFECDVNYLNLFLIGLFAAPVGMMGDLVFSVIKRQNNIKDFGNIMPGHGGVLDRFDSVILTAPFVYMVIAILPPVSLTISC